jgi:glutamate carboxypeptidase
LSAVYRAGRPLSSKIRRAIVGTAEVLFLAPFFLSGSVAGAQKLTDEEHRIVAFVNANAKDTVATLEKIVNIESPTQNLAGVRRAADAYRSELESIGFTTRWVDLPPDMKRAGHLAAERAGSSGKRILLLGHLDTVLSGEKFRLDGKRAYGTGTVDMTAGNVIMLYALKALEQAGVLKDRRIAVLLTGDEEAVGSPTAKSRESMVELAKRSDLALSFEACVRDTGTVGRRGSSSWTLEVTGKTGHSSGVFKPGTGAGAIYEAARILSSFYETLRDEKYLTFNTSVIAGGSSDVKLDGSTGSATGKINVIPSKAIAKGDLRFISDSQRDAARAKMREIVGQSLPETKAAITFSDGIPAMTPNEGNYALLKTLDRVSRDLGFGEVKALDPGERGAGDIAFIAHLVPCLDGLGGSGGNSHAAGEWVDTESLPKLIKRTALLIYRLSR